MREILFRGKTAGGEWIEGTPMFFTDNYAQILRPLEHAKTVAPETVGQYTGLTDKNGKKMFEGDIVTGLFLFGRSVNGVVAFRDGSFGLLWYRGSIETFNAFTSMCNIEYEVIGNIHDNPELLTQNTL